MFPTICSVGLLLLAVTGASNVRLPKNWIVKPVPTLSYLSYVSNKPPATFSCPKPGTIVVINSIRTNKNTKADYTTKGWANTGPVQDKIWKSCHMQFPGKACLYDSGGKTEHLTVEMKYDCVKKTDVRMYDICGKFSATVRTRFYLHSANYPGTNSLNAGQSCYCRMTFDEPKTFSVIVRQFQTTTNGALSLEWNGGQKKLAAPKKTTYLDESTSNLTYLLLSFRPSQTGFFKLWTAVESDTRWLFGKVEQNMELECQDRPFPPKAYDVCVRHTDVIRTPFYLQSPGYPNAMSFEHATACQCRIYTTEGGYKFTLAVKRFKTDQRNSLNLEWTGNTTGEKDVVSEKNQEVSDVVDDLSDLTLTFDPFKSGSGLFWISVESERKDDQGTRTIQQNIKVVCLDQPFQKMSSETKKTISLYILFNIIPIAVIVSLGIVVIIGLLIAKFCMKQPKAKPNYKLGTVDPTLEAETGPVAPSSSGGHKSKGDDPHTYENLNFEGAETRKSTDDDPPGYETVVSETRL